ncbi:lytic transglycosylase domain-containing protein [Cognatishimia sp. F0-27]|uniref:lytic transglycosylase domain-containing protein n=1 Tax=Cognatishimia sp. F0-27 TaxID=2816855 RepID=UPI001D0C5F33|nr:lytic transglycosylase domain-containing protein [Cognatishimia sp. F0-27]MCC1492249.1 lytic transglycosylase domain-containing protein [Cognatishimia sp. F0-27]
MRYPVRRLAVPLGVLGLALSISVTSVPPAAAQDGATSPRPFADFSAKRVKPPKPGQRRITVQVAPRANPAVPPPPDAAPAPVATAAVVAPAAPTGPSGARYAWYWSAVSPSLDDSGPGRLSAALSGLGKGPAGSSVASPRLQTLQDIAERYGRDILMATVGTRVSPALALAVIAVESSGREDVVSGAGAQGLMQLMPATAERFGVEDAFDTAENIAGGVRFLDFLMEKFDSDPILVLAGYNAGENAIPKHGGVPPYAETRDYVPKVLAAFDTARGLCMTRPELISDGCVFRISR